MRGLTSPPDAPATGGTWSAERLLFADVTGSPLATSYDIVSFHGWSSPAPLVFAMARGQFGVLTQELAPWPTLRLVTLPTAYVVADSGPSWTGLRFLDWDLPRLGLPAAIDLYSDSGDGTAFLAFATALGTPQTLGPPFEPGEALHLDPIAFLGAVEATALWPGRWRVDLGLQVAPPSLAGREFFIQGFQLSAASWTVTPALLVIPG